MLDTRRVTSLKIVEKEHCPNDVAEANGNAAQNKQSGVRCSYWIDKHRTPCGGTHTWEDHKAALAKFAPPKGKGGSTDKGGKSKGKGKHKDSSHALTEDQPEGQVNEDSLIGFLQEANWWSGESFSALTDAHRSGQHASTAEDTLEQECCAGLVAVPSDTSSTCSGDLHMHNCGRTAAAEVAYSLLSLSWGVRPNPCATED